MNVLLMNVSNTNVSAPTSGWHIAADDMGVYPPIGLLYLASSLRQHGRHAVKIVDTIITGMTLDDIGRVAKEEKPDIIGITVFTPTLYDAVQMTRCLKDASPSSRIVWGGPHTLAFPDESLQCHPVDYLIQGEGEIAFPALCDALEDKTDLAEVPGLVYQEDGAIKYGKPQSYVDEIDRIPFPPLDFLDMTKYHTTIGSGGATAIICSSRGCPFQCTYCWKMHSTYRSRSVANVLAEMEMYYQAGFREFFFFDDLFNITPKRVEELAQGILDRGWKIIWTFRGRVTAISPEMLSLAKRAGCWQILFGVETHSNEGFKEIKKKITIEQVDQAISLCRRHGIRTGTNWIIGLPHHRTRQDILDLIATAVRIDPDYANFNICMLYCGTEMFDDAVGLELVHKDTWVNFAKDPSPRFIMPIWDKSLSRNELSELLKLCYQRFYFRPMPILRKVMRMRNWAEFKLHLKAGFKLLASYFG